jgi:myo-inositol 2-dehydrogenase / D-chiro-inositol 1-dehydrogenase
MNEASKSCSAGSSRREFLKTSGAAVATGALAASLGLARQAHAAANDDTLKIALIGCGGRGTGAVKDAISAKGSNVKLIAMADAFRDHLDSSLDGLTKEFSERIDVPADRQFVGFNAYKDALATDADLVILATPPGFRPIHFDAAVKTGKHIFTEKPLATDAPGVRSILAANEIAKQKKLAVGVGLQRHHQVGYNESLKRYKDGAIGEFVAGRAYWNGTRPWTHRRNDLQTQLKRTLSEMEYQMRNWYYFVWICGDHIVEQHIHNLDVINWFKGDHPIRAFGMGGSQIARTPDDGEIFDHHCVEFEYADGSRMFSQCRHQKNTWSQVSEHIHGTKGTLHLDGGGNRYTIENPGQDGWRYRSRSAAGSDTSPYVIEHEDLQAAIKSGTTYNEIDFGAASTMTAILGRLATYSGNPVTWDEAMKSNVSVMPKEFSLEANPPTLPGRDGMYAQATPGVTSVV